MRFVHAKKVQILWQIFSLSLVYLQVVFLSACWNIFLSLEEMKALSSQPKVKRWKTQEERKSGCNKKNEEKNN
jgi:hypothetical protein